MAVAGIGGAFLLLASFAATKMGFVPFDCAVLTGTVAVIVLLLALSR